MLSPQFVSFVHTNLGESEDIHWGYYMEAAWNYFRKTYPDPIGNPDAEKLFAFLLGINSHQADMGQYFDFLYKLSRNMIEIQTVL